MVESVIESDDEDSLEFNLKQLAKVNKKNDDKTKKSKVRNCQMTSSIKRFTLF